MSAGTSIEWAKHTFNPWWGCVEAGPECDHCYASTFAHRLGLNLWGANAPRRMASEDYWKQPIAWDRKAAKTGERHRVFCASMGDVLEDRRDLDAPRERLWDLIERTPNLDWMLLTKRPSKFATLTPERWRQDGWPRNVWAGTSAGTQRTADVLTEQLVRATDGAAVRFISAEPLLEPVNYAKGLMFWAIHLVIVGGESGPGSRPMDLAWVRSVVEQCRAAGTACFVKQWGARPVDGDHRIGVYAEHDRRSIAAAKDLGRADNPPSLILLHDRKGGEPAEWGPGDWPREFPA